MSYTVVVVETVIYEYRVKAKSEKEAKDKVIMEDEYDSKRIIDSEVSDVAVTPNGQ